MHLSPLHGIQATGGEPDHHDGAPGEFLRTMIRRGDISRSIVVPEDLYDKAAELAAKDHVSVEEFVSALLASRLANREFIETRAQLFSREEFKRALSAVPEVEPGPYDRQ